MQTLVSRAEQQSRACFDQHSQHFIKQIFTRFKNDIIIITVSHTNDARSATFAAQHHGALARDAAPGSRVVCKYAPAV